MSYKYEVRDGAGRVSAGVIEAGSVAEASTRLRAQGGYLLNVAPLAAPAKNLLDRMRSVNIQMGPGLKDVQAFTTQLAVMIKAGISIRNAIGGIADQIENQKFLSLIHI